MLDKFEIRERHVEEAGEELYVYQNDLRRLSGLPQLHPLFKELSSHPGGLETAWTHMRLQLYHPETKLLIHQLQQPYLSCHPPRIDWRGMYGPRQFENLRGVIQGFLTANCRLLFFVTAWLEGELSYNLILRKQGSFGLQITQPSLSLQKMKFIDISETALPLRMLFDEIMAAYETTALPCDYLALASFPDFLTINWAYLKQEIQGEEYRTWRNKLIQDTKQAVQRFSWREEDGINEEPSESLQKKLSDHTEVHSILVRYQQQLASLVLTHGFYKEGLER